MQSTEQVKWWSGSFGMDYTNRNTVDLDKIDDCYLQRYGITRTEINSSFLRSIDRSAKILETGTNIGDQLLLLEQIGFSHLHGIDVQEYALDIARQRSQSIEFRTGSLSDIPFGDRMFDVVFTSGVLIHIAPDNLPRVLDEIYRCSSRYIWGFEYYAPQHEAISYHGMDSLLWKGNFSSMFQKRFPDLVLVKEEFFPYRDNPDNIDSMYLLCKGMP